MDLELLQLVMTATTAPVADLSAVVDRAAASVENYLLTSNMFIAAGAIFLLAQFAKRVPLLSTLMENQWVVRVMPLYPLAAGLGACFLPGALKLPDHKSGTVIVATIWVAAVSMIAHKFLGQTVLGDDPRISTLAVKSPGQYEPVMKKKG